MQKTVGKRCALLLWVTRESFQKPVQSSNRVLTSPELALRAMACRTSAARLLGLAPNASRANVRAAFRKKALETHPDRQGGCATQFLAARDAADLLLRPAPAVAPRAASQQSAPQQSHATDARAVAHRTIRSLDEELAAAFERMRTGPDLHVDPETLRVAGADEFPKEFELDERNHGVDGPLLRLRHGDRVIGCVEAVDEKLRMSLFGRDVATAERSSNGNVTVRRGNKSATLAPRPRTSYFDVADAFDTSGYTCVRVKMPGVTKTVWRSNQAVTVASVVRAWRPHRRWWPFGGDEEAYASDGAAASTYVERRAGDDRALAAADAPPPLDPVLVVAKVAFQALDRERVRVGAFSVF